MTISLFSETHLEYYRARYYHPQLQRFISEDPIQFAGGDVNLYVYVWNDPTRFVDPFGVWGFGIEGGGTAEVGAGPSGGAAYQAASGVGVFGRGLSALNVGGYTASGGFADAANIRQFVLGATAGLGTGLFLTNATRAEDLVGPFDTWTLNLPIVSFRLATAGGTWVGSFSVGRSRGFSVSRYSVTTTTGTTLLGGPPPEPLLRGENEYCGGINHRGPRVDDRRVPCDLETRNRDLRL